MKNNTSIDTSERNWWRDLNPLDYDNREAIQFIMDALGVEITRLHIELAGADISSEQGGLVDPEWYRAVVTVHEYAKEKRKQFHRRLEVVNRLRRDDDNRAAQELAERTLFLLARVEALLSKLEARA